MIKPNAKAAKYMRILGMIALVLAMAFVISVAFSAAIGG